MRLQDVFNRTSSHHQSSTTPRGPQYTATHSIASSTALHSSTMSDDGEERVTMPFKFVTGTSPTSPARTQWHHANFSQPVCSLWNPLNHFSCRMNHVGSLWTAANTTRHNRLRRSLPQPEPVGTTSSRQYGIYNLTTRAGPSIAGRTMSTTTSASLHEAKTSLPVARYAHIDPATRTQLHVLTPTPVLPSLQVSVPKCLDRAMG